MAAHSSPPKAEAIPVSVPCNGPRMLRRRRGGRGAKGTLHDCQRAVLNPQISRYSSTVCGTVARRNQLYFQPPQAPSCSGA